MYNDRVEKQVSRAHLSIVDGAWQESPDNLAIVDEDTRGTLFLIAEVSGDPLGRDALARDLIETARREYAANRGSIALALTLGIRAANGVLYNFNLNAAREARRIAGITAVVMRNEELFIAQGGPGLTCLVRDYQLYRYPSESPWYEPADSIGEFTSSGAVPLGYRRDYNPDVFHLTLEQGDLVLISTRSLVHLLTEPELLDTVLSKPPEEIVDNLEEIAGTEDLSTVVIRLGAVTEAIFQGDSRARGARELEEGFPLPHTAPLPRGRAARAQVPIEPPEPIGPAMSASAEEELPDIDETRSPALKRGTVTLRNFLSPLSSARDSLTGTFLEIDWTAVDSVLDRAASLLLRALAWMTRIGIRAFSPDDAEHEHLPIFSSRLPNLQKVWKIAALLLPIALMLSSGWAWMSYRVELQHTQAVQSVELVNQANAAVEAGKSISKTDKNAAREAFQKAVSLAQQAQKLNPNNSAAKTAYFQAADWLDEINGTSVIFLLPRFTTFSDPKSNPTRIVSRVPDIFILDRGLQRIYRYTMNEIGSVATPFNGDGVILKKDDRVGERTVSEIIDMVWVDAGRLVALDRAGVFFQYDPLKSNWTARAATDGSQWARVNLAGTFLGNLYLLDPSKDQIWKYAASAEGVWTSAVSYLAPGAKIDLSNVVDFAIDGDLWLLRGDGTIWRLSNGKLADYAVRDLDVPLSKPVGLFTTPTMVGLYVADAGNQRIVQIDKVTGRYTRQFKPKTELRDAFDALKTLTADELTKKFFFINNNQAFLASMPQ